MTEGLDNIDSDADVSEAVEVAKVVAEDEDEEGSVCSQFRSQKRNGELPFRLILGLAAIM